MRQLYLVPILIWPILAKAQDFGWFESHWVSDREVTMEANDAFQQLDDELRERTARIFGHVQWIIKDGMITASRPGQPSISLPYSIRPVDRATFEITIIYRNADQIATVTKTQHGFCIENAPDWNKEHAQWFNSGPVECFKPYDA